MDSVNLQKLFDLPNPKVFLSRNGVKSIHMEHVSLLVKIDARRSMPKLEKMSVVLMNVKIVDDY